MRRNIDDGDASSHVSETEDENASEGEHESDLKMIGMFLLLG